MESHTLIINTTPLGMFPKVDTNPNIPYQEITSRHLLFDLVYNPEETRFLRQGKEQGASIVNGSDMLIYQAEGSWEIWNKKR
jgi:shikimate dehydrogenase